MSFFWGFLVGVVVGGLSWIVLGAVYLAGKKKGEEDKK